MVRSGLDCIFTVRFQEGNPVSTIVENPCVYVVKHSRPAEAGQFKILPHTCGVSDDNPTLRLRVLLQEGRETGWRRNRQGYLKGSDRKTT